MTTPEQMTDAELAAKIAKENLCLTDNQRRLIEEVSKRLAAMASQVEENTHEYRLAVAYQVVGALLDHIGAFDTDEGQSLLSYLNMEEGVKDPLPFDPGKLSPSQVEGFQLVPDYRSIALQAMKDMRESGESFEMCARWISERIGKALAAAPKQPVTTAQGSGWRSMESAPKEGQFLVWLPEKHFGMNIHTARFHPNLKMVGGTFAFDLPAHPTRWMPLPAPPAQEEG